jgi:hypothetical protein
MTTTNAAARLALSERQRRFEWVLARDEQTRAAGAFVAGKTHDLLNLIQIVNLATLELGKRCEPSANEFLDDLLKAARGAQIQLDAMMAVARPAESIVRGAPVGAAAAAAIATMRTVFEIDIHLATPPSTVTRCTAEELEHLFIGLALDAADSYSERNVLGLLVRERSIDGKPWIEIVRTCREAPLDPDRERFELRVVEVIAAKAKGEVSYSTGRDGGEELVVALPVLR